LLDFGSEGAAGVSPARKGRVNVLPIAQAPKERPTMPQSFSCLHVHLIFSTKNREPLIVPELAKELYPYIGGIARNRKCTLLRIGGVEDHVHLLVRMARDIAVSEFVNAVKSVSSGWIHETFPAYQKFAWQHGYAAFAVSLSGVDDVVEYIDGQTEHHRKRTFQEELRTFLDKHGIEYDERYMWD
jgi:putative transposase